jgi:hypothetical protein
VLSVVFSSFLGFLEGHSHFGVSVHLAEASGNDTLLSKLFRVSPFREFGSDFIGQERFVLGSEDGVLLVDKQAL